MSSLEFGFLSGHETLKISKISSPWRSRKSVDPTSPCDKTDRSSLLEDLGCILAHYKSGYKGCVREPGPKAYGSEFTYPFR